MNRAGEECQEFVDTQCDIAVKQGVRGVVMGMNLAGKLSPMPKMMMRMGNLTLKKSRTIMSPFQQLSFEIFCIEMYYNN